MRGVVRRPLVLAALALAVAPAPARAYVTQGQPWPGGRILYFNEAADQAWAVQQAVAAWNASGAAVQFVPAPEATAQVVIRDFDHADCTSTHDSVGGEATIGYAPHSQVWVTPLDQATPKCNQYSAAQALAHELGHVLGLGHETHVCAAMNPSGSMRGPSLCRPAPVGEWNCGLLEPDDVAGAVALYGGTPRGVARTCSLYRGVAPPAKLTLAGAGVAGSIVASFVRPPDPTLPAFLAPVAGRASYAAAIARDRCPSPASASRVAWSAGPRGTETARFDALGPGRWCVGVRAFDQLGRPGPRTTAWIRMVPS